MTVTSGDPTWIRCLSFAGTERQCPSVEEQYNSMLSHPWKEERCAP